MLQYDVQVGQSKFWHWTWRFLQVTVEHGIEIEAIPCGLFSFLL